MAQFATLGIGDKVLEKVKSRLREEQCLDLRRLSFGLLTYFVGRERVHKCRNLLIGIMSKIDLSGI
jgi:hypothetical protein